MNMNNRAHTNQKDGVALIICLGLLSVMTLVAVTFSISMRVERMAARNFADGVRAKIMVQTAFVRALEYIETNMVPASGAARIYPPWDVTASVGGPLAQIMTAQAETLIPSNELLTMARSAKPEWITINTGIATSRVSYIIINTSGLLDINAVGSSQRVWSTDIKEVDARGAAGINTTNARTALVTNRVQFGQFETIDEIQKLSSEVTGPLQTFQTFSYDPAPDKVFLTVTTNAAGPSWWNYIDTAAVPAQMGRRSAELYLHDKFNINSMTNWPVFQNARYPRAYQDDTQFIAQIYTPLTNMLVKAGLNPSASPQERPDDVAWNIINYMDPDRIPQGDIDSDYNDVHSWVHSEGGEAIPLVNEIAITETNIYASNSVTTTQYLIGTGYVVNVELWYPFAPANVELRDDFGCQIWIYTGDLNSPTTARTASPASSTWDVNTMSSAVTNQGVINTNFSATYVISNMVYGTSTEFLTFKSKPIIFGPYDKGSTNLIPGRLGSGVPVNAFYVMARVVKRELNPKPGMGYVYIPVDEGLQYDPSKSPTRLMPQINSLGSYEINDPRSNGQLKYWTGINGGFRSWTNTLGATNSVCDPWSRKGGGVPIYAQTNGFMTNIGELGHIFRSNLDDEQVGNGFWRNLNLMHALEGAMMLDMMMVGNARTNVTGLICVNSRQTNFWKTVFYNLRIGITNEPNATPYNVPGSNPYKVSDAEIDLVIRLLINDPSKANCVRFFNLFTADDQYNDDGGGGNIATAFRYCSPDPDDHQPDIYKEDTFRSICELLTFRQNIFTIVMAAQVMAPDGTTPIAERRAIATVYRDAYTGRHFTKNFKWLDD